MCNSNSNGFDGYFPQTPAALHLIHTWTRFAPHGSAVALLPLEATLHLIGCISIGAHRTALHSRRVAAIHVVFTDTNKQRAQLRAPAGNQTKSGLSTDSRQRLSWGCRPARLPPLRAPSDSSPETRRTPSCCFY